MNLRGTPFDRNGFNWMVTRGGKKAGLPFQIHAHMIRHATGYKLANAGKDTRSIQGYLATRIFGIRFATPSCRRRVSRTFGLIDKITRCLQCVGSASRSARARRTEFRIRYCLVSPPDQ